MSLSKMHLTSDNYDVCRICLLEPDTNREVKFLDIFSSNNEGLVLSDRIKEFFGFIVDLSDLKSKIICQHCYNSIFGWVKFKEKAFKSQNIFNQIIKLRYSSTPRISTSLEVSQSSSNVTYKSTHSRSTIVPTKSFTHSSSKSPVSNNSRTNIDIAQNNHCQSISIKPLPKSQTDDQPSVSLDNTFCEILSSDCESDYDSNSRNSDVSTKSFKNSSLKSSISNNSMTKLYITQNNHCQSTSNKQLPKSQTDDQSSVSLDNTFCQILSSDCKSDCESFLNFNSKNEPHIKNDKTYCSICKKKQYNNHDCSQFNKEFSSCLVPYCNILFRSATEFLSHYQQHSCKPKNETSTNEESKKSDSNENSHYSLFCGKDLFKCFMCNVSFDETSKLAIHKLKTHNARLKNSLGHYLCLFCEKSSPDLTKMNEHIKQCCENPTDAVYECHTKLKDKNIPLTPKNVIYTCNIEACNLIFDNISHYKSHYCEHFGISEDLMCWQCFSPFNKSISLYYHQTEAKCQTPSTFKCFECSIKCNDLQSLGIHKITNHNGQLISDNHSIKCVYCKIEINMLNLKSHLIECQLKKDVKCIKTLKCAFCYNNFRSGAALTSHIKTHLSKDLMKPKENSYSMKRKLELTTTRENKTNRGINKLPSTSKNNGSIGFDDYNMTHSTVLEKET